MTLLELLVSLSIVVMVVGTLGGIARAIQLAFDYNQSYGTATQHGRVVLERITRTAQQATANERFPGLIVLADQVGPWRFPDTLVVWHPDGPPAAPDGLPRLSELVIYCPHPQQPTALVEITTDQVGTLSENKADWPLQIEAIKRSPYSRTVTLTEMLRTCCVSSLLSASSLQDEHVRAAVRFETLLRPSEAEWTDTARPWSQLSWVQNIYGPQTGLRQVWLRIELQLVSGPAQAEAADSRQVLPFFGSVALYYTMHKEQRP